MIAVAALDSAEFKSSQKWFHCDQISAWMWKPWEDFRGYLGGSRLSVGDVCPTGLIPGAGHPNRSGESPITSTHSPKASSPSSNMERAGQYNYFLSLPSQDTSWKLRTARQPIVEMAAQLVSLEEQKVPYQHTSQITISLVLYNHCEA